MKLSRKVGRRSRKHTSSSISRRRLMNKKTKSGYKKKYAKTQKGGKRGRSYKRVRVRTHKRGRRFHRGGFNCDTLTTKSYGDRRFYYGDTPKITYNKKGYPEDSSIFEVCFVIEFMEKPKRVKINIDFTRKSTHGQPESESPKFVFELLCEYSDVITSLDSILKPFTTDRITESDKEYSTEVGMFQRKPNVKTPLREYIFTSKDNTEIFKNIIECIKKKLRQYFESKYPDLLFDSNFNQKFSATQVNSGSDLGSVSGSATQVGLRSEAQAPRVNDDIPQTATRILPEGLDNPKNNVLNTDIYFKLDDPVILEYKKKYIPGKPEPKQFDVFIPVQLDLPCILLRYDSNDPLKYDKLISISIGELQTNLPYTDIVAKNPYNTDESEGTYTFPLTTTNTESFKTIKSAAIESE